MADLPTYQGVSPAQSRHIWGVRGTSSVSLDKWRIRETSKIRTETSGRYRDQLGAAAQGTGQIYTAGVDRPRELDIPSQGQEETPLGS